MQLAKPVSAAESRVPRPAPLCRPWVRAGEEGESHPALSESSAPWKEGLENDGRRPRDGGDNGNGRQREPLSCLGRAARSLGVFKVLKANSKF